MGRGRIGVGRLLTGSVALSALALLCCAVAPAYWLVVACAVLFGLSSGAIDAALNAYAARHFGPPPDQPHARGLRDRGGDLATGHDGRGGSAELIGQVERFLTRRQHALNSCQRTVLCHNDFIDGNLLVTAAGDPVITGVIDFERASFGDPMADLAQTLRNATFNQSIGAEELAAAYGVDAADQERLAIHDLLHTLAERVWISTDRPTGWRSSVRQLDAHLHCVSQRA